MKRTLYKDEKGKLLFRHSFCAYLDILGFSEKIVKNDLEFFSMYLNTLDKELHHIEEVHDLSGKEGYKSFELKIFTDNFVFGHPWFDQYGESELGNIFEVLSHIQFTFVKSNIFIRGAISMSGLYMDDNIVLGPAIIESYKLESEKSIYPRIILSNDVISVVKKHMGFYGDKKSSPQAKEYLIDIDGHWFLNYLFILFYDSNYPENIIIDELKKHKEPIVTNLISQKENFKLFDKYSWVAKYHNYFCDNFILKNYPSIKLTDIKIEEKLYKKDIMPIL